MHDADGPPRPRHLTLLLACGVAGAVLFNAAYLIAGALHRGYDPTHDPISRLELLANGWTQQADFILFAVLSALFGAGMREELAGGAAALWYPVLRWISAFGLVLSGVFVRNPLHTTGDLVTFLASATGLVVIAGRFAREPRWRGWATYSIASAVVMVVLLAAFGVTMRRGGPAGLLERLAAGVPTLWIVLLTAKMLLAGARLPAGRPAHRRRDTAPVSGSRPPRR